MKRKVLIGTGFLALIGGLLVAQGILGRAAIVEAQGKPQAPRFEVDPFWPKPLPNHWLLGNAIGVWVDEQDNVWIVHRGSGHPQQRESGLELKTGDCCAGAAGARLRQGRQPRPAAGAGRARATTGPRRTTASSSITPATSGSAATARATRTS